MTGKKGEQWWNPKGISRLKNPKEAAINILYRTYKSTAKRRGLDFNLDKFLFLSIVTNRCEYCGVEPQHEIKSPHLKGEEEIFVSNGIDRIDNSKGYVDGNVVPCCTTCNYAKRTLTVEQFLSWINRVYKHSVASVSEKTPGMLFDELITTDIKCFMAQEDIMNPSLSSDVQSSAAHRAQQLNARRNKLIRALDSYFNLEDNSHTAKTYYTYLEKDKE